VNNVNIKNAPLAIRKLLDGSSSPYDFDSVKRWVNECYNTPSHYELVMEAANEVLVCFGVEALGNVSAVYCNTGDTYATTLIYDLENDRYLWSAWGDFVEQEEKV